MKDLKKDKKDYSLAFLIIIGLFIILVGSCVAFYLCNKNSKTSICNFDNNDDLYATYLANMKKNINSLEDKQIKTLNLGNGDSEQIETYECFEKSFEFTNNSANDDLNSTASVAINSKEEAYIYFQDDISLSKKYGSSYKLGDNIIQLFKVNTIQDDNTIIFMLKDDGTLLYLASSNLENGDIKVNSINNLKNIINVDTKTSFNSDTNCSIVAIDIDGNMYELNNLIG